MARHSNAATAVDGIGDVIAERIAGLAAARGGAASVAGPPTSVVVGTGGADVLFGAAPTEPYEPGPEADDFILAGAGGDTIFGNLGHDIVDGGAGDDVISTADGPEASYIDFLADVIIAGSGDDVVTASMGGDLVAGGTGADLLRGDQIEGAASIPGGDDTLLGGAGSDTVRGGTGNDRLAGDGGHDSLDASFGDDTVTGGAGDDTLLGWAGDDLLTGGRGDDRFVYITAFVSPGAAVDNGNDTISGFSAGDRLLTRDLLDDADGDGIVQLAADGVLELPTAPPQFIPGGTITLPGVTALRLVGEETPGGLGGSFFAYELLEV